MTEKTLTVTLTRSMHGRGRSQRSCVKGLGLRRINHSVQLEDTPAVRGMIRKVAHLVRVQDH